MQRTRATDAEADDCFERDLVNIAFDLEFAFSNSARFVPVDFSEAFGPIMQSYPNNTFPFPPASRPIHTPQSLDLSNSSAGRDRLDLSDPIQDLKIHP